jgi:large subunit ribosomal protein L4
VELQVYSHTTHDAVSTLTVLDAIFAKEYNEPLIHQAVQKSLAGWRQGSSQTKSRADVRGGGKKPWRQKGTGRARAGSIRGPIWRGGGHTFAKAPRDFSQKMNKKAMKGAFSSILSELLRQDRLKVLDNFSIAEGKTKVLIQKLAALGFKENVLVIVSDFDYNLMLAARNIPNVSVMEMHDIDPVDLVGFNNIVITVECVKFFEERLASC